MQGLTDRNDPVAEAALKGNGVQSVEETLERIVRRDAVGQGEEASQPRLPTLGPSNDFRPGIGTAQDGADGDYDDVHQQVQTPMGTARVFQLAEVSLEGKGQRDRAGGRVGRGGRRHDSPLWRARAEENGRGWSLTKSTSNEECGRSMRRRPWAKTRPVALADFRTLARTLSTDRSFRSTRNRWRKTPSIP